LADVLAAKRPEIEEQLLLAEADLEECRRHCDELDAVIARARAALGNGPTEAMTPPSRLTLHEAMSQVLRANGNRPLRPRELAAAVNEQRLYRKRDDSPVDVNQIHARTNNYPHLFEKVDGFVRLRT
jgi:hypothetical protein